MVRETLYTVAFIDMGIILELNIFISWQCSANYNVQKKKKTDLSVKDTVLDILHTMLVLKKLKNWHDFLQIPHQNGHCSYLMIRQQETLWLNFPGYSCHSGVLATDTGQENPIASLGMSHWLLRWTEHVMGTWFLQMEKADVRPCLHELFCPLPLSFCPRQNKELWVHLHTASRNTSRHLETRQWTQQGEEVQKIIQS